MQLRELRLFFDCGPGTARSQKSCGRLYVWLLRRPPYDRLQMSNGSLEELSTCPPTLTFMTRPPRSSILKKLRKARFRMCRGDKAPTEVINTRLQPPLGRTSAAARRGRRRRPSCRPRLQRAQASVPSVDCAARCAGATKKIHWDALSRQCALESEGR